MSRLPVPRLVVKVHSGAIALKWALRLFAVVAFVWDLSRSEARQMSTLAALCATLAECIARV